MDALLTAFLAAAIAEFGDKTQLLVIALAAHYARPVSILAGVFAAALLSASIAAVGGAFLHDLVTPRAISLLVALALVFVGVSGLFRFKPPRTSARLRGGAFIAAASGAFLLEFGDRTQFVTGALAAQYGSFALTAVGAAAVVTAASIPAAFLGGRLPAAVPVRAIRIGLSILLLGVGLVVAILASRLV